MTSIPGVFACGNGLHVHDLVDFVTHQAAKAAEGAVRYLKQETSSENGIAAVPGENVGYVVPGILHPKKLPPAIEFYFRGILFPRAQADEFRNDHRALWRSGHPSGSQGKACSIGNGTAHSGRKAAQRTER